MPELKAAIIPVTPVQQNCTLLWDDASKAAMVVDPGGDVPTIRRPLKLSPTMNGTAIRTCLP